MMEGAKANMEAIGCDEDYFSGATFVADTNYHSQSNLKSCQKLELDAYIADKHFRRRDPRYATQKRHWPKKKKFGLEYFHYDEPKDQYICPNGKRLELKVREILASGYCWKTICGRGEGL
jgi:hypothetical protein